MTAQRQIIDSRGSVCPGPILDLFKAFRKAKDGDEVELLATDPAAQADATAWAKRNRSDLLEVVNENGVLRIAIRFRKER